MLAQEDNHNSSSILWPHLKHLDVLDFDQSLLCNLLRYRINIGKPMKSVDGEGFMKSTGEEVLRIVQERIDLEVRDP